MRGDPSSAEATAKSAAAGARKMDERTKELVAIGAAAAANCHPCMDHHLARCDQLGVPREEVAEAVKVGLMVNHGAERAIRKKARELLGESMIEAA
jgi:AhpD family alkylhydroperoxidase